jgi:hypothetical protein
VEPLRGVDKREGKGVVKEKNQKEPKEAQEAEEKGTREIIR